jgi:hypothetical protein
MKWIAIHYKQRGMLLKLFTDGSKPIMYDKTISSLLYYHVNEMDYLSLLYPVTERVGHIAVWKGSHVRMVIWPYVQLLS